MYYKGKLTRMKALLIEWPYMINHKGWEIVSATMT